MVTGRKINFGKYKGSTIKWLILAHIGYVMWCINNVKYFKLDEKEQELFDYMAIAMLKYKPAMTFPIEDLRPLIKNAEALEKMDTPFILHNGSTQISKEHPLYKEILCNYREFDDENFRRYTNGLLEISDCAKKEFIVGSSLDITDWEDVCSIEDDDFYFTQDNFLYS